MKIVKVEIEGMSPGLLMHNAEAMTKAAEGGGRKVGRKIPSPEVEAEAGAYRLGDGMLGFPTAGVRKCILTAAKPFKAIDREKGTILRYSVSPLLAGAMQLEPAGMLLAMLRGGKPIKDYTRDTRRAVPKGQGAVARSRPLVPTPWQMSFDLLFDEEILTEGFLTAETGGMHHVIRHGGIVVGLGDYRPEKGGWFGKFEVTRFEMVG